jgi:hypothetical protein
VLETQQWLRAMQPDLAWARQTSADIADATSRATIARVATDLTSVVSARASLAAMAGPDVARPWSAIQSASALAAGSDSMRASLAWTPPVQPSVARDLMSSTSGLDDALRTAKRLNEHLRRDHAAVRAGLGPTVGPDVARPWWGARFSPAGTDERRSGRVDAERCR